jgi:CheY-like chemotaxis protein
VPPRARPQPLILLADDDEDDRQLTTEALGEAQVRSELRCVEDGEELLDYLRRRGVYGPGGRDATRPGVILLDLNMPRMDGREALSQIKSDPELRRIPVVVLTTSRSEEDVVRSYELGANSFITKPTTFTGLVEVARGFARYWFELAELPRPRPV